ncbi:MAG: hypothetical protein AB7K41_09890 [Bdellovibrionales bacterium]
MFKLIHKSHYLKFIFAAGILFAEAALAREVLMNTNLEVIKLSNGSQLTIERNGYVTLKGKPPMSLFKSDEAAQVARFSVQEVSTDLYLFVAVGTKDPSQESPIVSRHLVARLDTKEGVFRWRSSLNSYENLLSALLYQDVVICVFDNLIYGLEQKTGTLRWGFWVYSGYVEPFAIRKAELTDSILYIQGESAGKPHSIELDARTGERVYKNTQYVSPEEEPHYTEEIRKKIIQQDARSRMGSNARRRGPGKERQKKIDDLPAPVPKNWNAVRVVQTILAWNLETGEGIIINPTKSDAEKIVKIAKGKTVTIGGNSSPVRWLYVFDTEKIYSKSKRFSRGRILGDLEKKYPEAKLVYPEAYSATDPALGGQRVDAQTVAKTLGAKAWTEKMDEIVMTDAGPLIPRSNNLFSIMEPDAEGSFLALEWGPYQFAMTHTRLIPSVSIY